MKNILELNECRVYVLSWSVAKGRAIEHGEHFFCVRDVNTALKRMYEKLKDCYGDFVVTNLSVLFSVSIDEYNAMDCTPSQFDKGGELI